MKKIEFEKKYFLDCYSHEYQAIYLGQKLKKSLKNKHFFMVMKGSSSKGDNPFIIGCKDFEIEGENKLQTSRTRMYFPRISKLEQDYLEGLAKKLFP